MEDRIQWSESYFGAVLRCQALGDGLRTLFRKNYVVMWTRKKGLLIHETIQLAAQQ